MQQKAVNDDTLWGTYDRRLIRLGDMEPKHLANIVFWIKTRRGLVPDAHPEWLEHAMEAYAKQRLGDNFLAMAPFPFRNQAGEWVTLDVITAKEMKVKPQ